MGKTKLLLDVVRDMRSLADSIQAVCDAMTDNGPATETKPDAREEIHPQADITLEEVRTALAEKSQLGMTGEVRRIIQKYGANKLSEVPSKHYAAILKDAEVLGNG